MGLMVEALSRFGNDAFSVWPDDWLQPEFPIFRADFAGNTTKRTFRPGNKKRPLFRTIRLSIVFHR